MKLELSEIRFLQLAIDATTIKASDAPQVGAVVTKINKEHDRLKKLAETTGSHK